MNNGTAKEWRGRRRLGVLVAGTTALAAIGCGGGGEAAPAMAAARGGPGARAVAVSTEPVVKGSIARSITVSGVVEPIRTIAVNSQLGGALTAVEAQEGDVVRSGEVLARLDDRELAAQLRSAEASFDVAESAYERAERLREEKIITLPEYERDRAAYAAARARRDQLRTRIGYATVRAPLAGVVLEKRVETGDVVGLQTRLFTIADVSTMVVRVGISELDVVDLAEGDPVGIILDAFPERTLHGRIRRVFPAADPTTRLVPVEVALDVESAHVARPGFLARTTFALGARTGVLLIPASALIGAGGSEAVFVIREERAVRRSIQTGLTSEGRIEVLSGLDVGEQVVTAGNRTLRDGAYVRVIDSSGRGASAAPGRAERPGMMAAPEGAP